MCFISVPMGRKIIDLIAFGSCIAMVLIVGLEMFKGGASWFAWHPVLMTLAFPCLMTLGRWSYQVDDSWGLGDKASRRTTHGICMGTAGATMLVGYLCIFMAHLDKKSFFGYQFAEQQWNPDIKRIAHSMLGYLVIVAAVCQACIGIAKKMNLDNGFRTLTFHGTLGKVVMFGGAINMLLAILFWGWSTLAKIRLIALLAVTLMFSAVLPLPQDFVKKFGCPAYLTEQNDSESQALASKA